MEMPDFEPAPVRILAAPAPQPAPAIAIRAARAKLNAPSPEPPVWPLMGAAAFAAFSAMVLVVAIIVGPPHLG